MADSFWADDIGILLDDVGVIVCDTCPCNPIICCGGNVTCFETTDFAGVTDGAIDCSSVPGTTHWEYYGPLVDGGCEYRPTGGATDSFALLEYVSPTECLLTFTMRIGAGVIATYSSLVPNPFTLPFVVDFFADDGSCTNWAATITLTACP